jgi:ABC-type transporter Mla subunit MlaD
MAHAHPSTMLEGTLQTLQQRDVQPATGADLIKDWISVLKHTTGAEPAAQSLQSLYDELHSMEPNGERIRDLLNQVAQQTEHLSRSADSHYADSLKQLASSLRSFAIDLERA